MGGSGCAPMYACIVAISTAWEEDDFYSWSLFYMAATD